MNAKNNYTKALPTPLLPGRVTVQHPNPFLVFSKAAFSLVEMLMALLVASLLMAALAPVMTRKLGENITFEGTLPSLRNKTHTIDFNSNECNNLLTEKDENGNIISEYCEGEFTVPLGYNGPMKITLIGAGGGGGSASTAGYVEYTIAGSTNTFTVPNMVNKLEATLISGGAGGGAGGQVTKTQTFDTPGVFAWDDFPEIIKGKYVNVMGCGGGGGGGGASIMSDDKLYKSAGGGGSGGYLKTPVTMLISASATSIPYQVGGGGGGASSGGGYNKTNPPSAGACGGGGDGGSDDGILASNSCNPRYGGASGTQAEPLGASSLVAAGGGKPSGGNGVARFYNTVQSSSLVATGGAGVEGGNGGNSGSNLTTVAPYGYGGGGGGGKYGGGGGGAGCSAPGGGGGGPTYFNDILIASGGGGGGGGGQGSSGHCPGGGGGGGGGKNGGNGGNGADATIETIGGYGAPGAGGYPNGVTAIASWTAYDDDLINLYGWGPCLGGMGGGLLYSNNTHKGSSGGNGIIKVTYLDYGSGGSGGGGATIVPIQPLNVSPADNLKIIIAERSNNQTGGYIDSSGAVNAPTIDYRERVDAGTFGNITYITNEDSNKIMFTHPALDNNSSNSGCSNGVSDDGHPNWCSTHGTITNGKPSGYAWVTVNGFSSTAGVAADESKGGNGGVTITPWFKCEAAKGGENSGEKGGDATGYGCGGGGGYGLSDGGKGSGGYARISWNKYWDVAKKAYYYAQSGAGGGGASGNVLTYTINVSSGEVIKIRIGKGGEGGKAENNVFISSKKGGDTSFAVGTKKEGTAGGGTGGGNVSIVQTNETTTAIINGSGGKISEICTSPNNSSAKCTKGTQGSIAEGNTGGKGADLMSYGIGGSGGISGNNAFGKNASGYGSGGGGAGILDIGTPAITTFNNNTGGRGSDGRIILQWSE